MYRMVLDSIRYEGPLVRFIAGATRDAQNWRMDRRALCVEHILLVGAYRTKLCHCFVPSIIHLPRLGGLGRTARGRHNWKKARRNSGNQNAHPPWGRKGKTNRRGFEANRSFKDCGAPRMLLSYFYSTYDSFLHGTVKVHANYWRIQHFQDKILISVLLIDYIYLCNWAFTQMLFTSVLCSFNNR